MYLYIHNIYVLLSIVYLTSLSSFTYGSTTETASSTLSAEHSTCAYI